MASIDFSKPATTDNYSTGFVPNIQANQVALGMMLDSFYVSITGAITAGTKRFNRAAALLEEWNGSAWVAVPFKATQFQTARNINGVPFDGTADIAVGDTTKLPLTGGPMSGTITGAGGPAEFARMNNNSAFIAAYNTAGTTRTGFVQFVAEGGGVYIAAENGSFIGFITSGSERTRVDAVGNFGVNTSTFGAVNSSGATAEPYAGGIVFNVGHSTGAAGGDAFINFRRNGTVLGAITQVGTSGVAFSGVSATATVLATARNINGVSFNGGADISIPATSDGTNELGYKGLPAASVTTGAFAASDRGKCIYATGGVTVPNGIMAAGDVVTIDNTTGAAITITASVATLRRAGTTDTGNRTLAAYGIATVLFEGGVIAKISGSGLS